ncbi:Transferrin binding protein-like solute binding protein [Noviherbaspirillum humi]|uniref:Transferrin binding protein-like solute binding protein n=1 Tax=Noviherbaspirillum humi TaxID=1688639 RepID=A0A239EAP6_9BURK|nr:transferrin-binding protein-like solute binding protein [Noviherbaspirillum humi]SNS41840.1 Transferrin binding protein-like solute binding protein [Noviherbaspirillum humi]
MSRRAPTRKLLSLLVTLAVVGCGGGGGSDSTSAATDSTKNNTGTNTGGTNTGGTNTGGTNTGGTNTGGTNTGGTNTGGTNTGGTATAGPAAVAAGTSLVMSCADGTEYQCSGSSVIRVDNGIGLSSSGVQAYGKSTTDTAATIADPANPTGFDVATGGVSEVRVAKSTAGVMSNPRLILSKLGGTYDGRTEAPTTVETFNDGTGRVTLGSDGRIAISALPAASDTSFYNYNSATKTGTQTNYANNIYFATATGQPSRVQYSPGEWRVNPTTSSIPDSLVASRMHEDGDIHAPTPPSAGTKGFRSLSNYAFNYGNLAQWITQDTVQIAEWGATGAEHNQIRRGVNAFGSTTPVAAIPTTGTASYSGRAYGWYTDAKDKEPTSFYGDVTVTVNFATREVTVAFLAPKTFNDAGTALPAVAFTNKVLMGAAGSNVTNYLNGTATIGSGASALNGGLSGRFFGPAADEVGGAFSMNNANAAVVGGFISRKQ